MKHLGTVFAVSALTLCAMSAADAEVFKCINPAGKLPIPKRKKPTPNALR